MATLNNMTLIKSKVEEFKKLNFKMRIYDRRYDNEKDIMELVWKSTIPKLELWLTKALEEVREETLKGQLYEKVYIQEEVLIPEKIKEHIRVEERKRIKGVIEGEKINEPIYGTTWNDTGYLSKQVIYGYNQALNDILSKI